MRRRYIKRRRGRSSYRYRRGSARSSYRRRGSAGRRRAPVRKRIGFRM